MRKVKRGIKRKVVAYAALYFCVAGMAASVFLFVFGIVHLVGRIKAPAGKPVVSPPPFTMRQEPEDYGDPEAGGLFTNRPANGRTPEEGEQPGGREAFTGTMDAELLVLVNRENPLSEEYDAKLRKICNGRLEASGRLYEDLCAMLEAASESGYSYWIASAYRSREYQQKLVDEDIRAFMGKGYSYEEAEKKTYEETMPAGCSEHETGLALDILCAGNSAMDTTQASEPGNVWLREHCAEYGFILRYPKDSEEITGISYEPWHFRYVGRDAAAYLAKYHLTLEELFKD